MKNIKLINLMRSIKDGLLEMFFPNFCITCDALLTKHEAGICGNCFSKIPINDSLFCSQCKNRLPDAKKTCHKSAFLLGAATQYNNEIAQKLIWSLKYGKKLAATRALARILAQYMKTLPLAWNDFAIVSVPLHPIKEKLRGFNQVKLLENEIHKQFPMPSINKCIIKLKNNQPQADINELDQRLENVKGAYAIVTPELVKDKKIIVLDDVFTTGATMKEVCEILKKAGVKKTIGLVAAKT